MPYLNAALSNSEPTRRCWISWPGKAHLSAAAVALATLILAAWFIPALGSLLPAGWDVMRAETASPSSSPPSALNSVNCATPAATTRSASWSLSLSPVCRRHPPRIRTSHLPRDRHAPSLRPGTGDQFLEDPRLRPPAVFSCLGYRSASSGQRTASPSGQPIWSLLPCLCWCWFLFRERSSARSVSSAFPPDPHFPTTLACLVLLTVVALLRRAERGVLSIFLGVGSALQPPAFSAPFSLSCPSCARSPGRA